MTKGQLTKKLNGFTLFELLISISIIGILVALAVVSFSSSQKKARDSRRMQDMGMIQKAAEQYYSLNNSNYPTNCTSGSVWTVNGQVVLESIPNDPKGVGYSNGGSYYFSTCSSSQYCYCAALEGRVGNSTNQNCTFVGAGGTGPFTCVRNQQ